MLGNLLKKIAGGRGATAPAAAAPLTPAAVAPAQAASDRPAPMPFGSRQLLRCRYGWMLFHGPFIGKCFELYGEYSEAEVALMRQLVRLGDQVIDVGANIGDLTLPLAQMVGPAGRVH